MVVEVVVVELGGWVWLLCGGCGCVVCMRVCVSASAGVYISNYVSYTSLMRLVHTVKFVDNYS